MNEFENRAPSARGIASFALALGLASFAVSVSANEYELSAVDGTVEWTRGSSSEWTAAQAGQTLEAGWSLRTGARSRAEVRSASRTLRLYENSLVRLAPAKPARLESGTVLIDVDPDASRATPFEIETPEIVAVVKGTRFSVSAGGISNPLLAVFEGEVEARLARGDERFPVRVRPGFALGLRGESSLHLFVHEATDPWGAWGTSDARPPELIRDRESRAQRVLIDDVDEKIMKPPASRIERAPRTKPLDPVLDVADPNRLLEDDDSPLIPPINE